MAAVLLLVSLAGGAYAELARLSPDDMRETRGTAYWKCKLPCVTQHQVHNVDSTCYPYTDLSMPCVQSRREVGGSAKECGWALIGGCREDAFRTCRYMNYYLWSGPQPR